MDVKGAFSRHCLSALKIKFMTLISKQLKVPYSFETIQTLHITGKTQIKLPRVCELWCAKFIWTPKTTKELVRVKVPKYVYPKSRETYIAKASIKKTDWSVQEVTSLMKECCLVSWNCNCIYILFCNDQHYVWRKKCEVLNLMNILIAMKHYRGMII